MENESDTKSANEVGNVTDVNMNEAVVSNVVKRKCKPDINLWNRQENNAKRQKGEKYKGLHKNEAGK